MGICSSPEGANVGRGGSCSVPAAPPTTAATSQGNCLKNGSPRPWNSQLQGGFLSWEGRDGLPTSGVWWGWE